MQMSQNSRRQTLLPLSRVEVGRLALMLKRGLRTPIDRAIFKPALSDARGL